jgi:hypothetical protein
MPELPESGSDAPWGRYRTVGILILICLTVAAIGRMLFADTLATDEISQYIYLALAAPVATRAILRPKLYPLISATHKPPLWWIHLFSGVVTIYIFTSFFIFLLGLAMMWSDARYTFAMMGGAGMMVACVLSREDCRLALRGQVDLC